MYLVELLQNSMRHKEILQRRLSYFEKREEDDLIHQSLEYDRHKENISMRKNKYRYSESSSRAMSTYSPRNCNFSPNFNP